MSQNFFNENQFVSTAKQVLATEQSRQAIAGTIADAAFQNNPVAERLIELTSIKEPLAALVGLVERCGRFGLCAYRGAIRATGYCEPG